MPTELTPHAVARVRRWMNLLATDESAPRWDPTVNRSTPESLRRVAWWLVSNGEAPDMTHEMVCILLALYIVDHRDELEGELIPRDAA